MKRKASYLLLSSLLFVFACSDALTELLEAEGISWNPRIAVPLIDAEFSFNDLVEEVDSITLVEIQPNGLINLIYNSDLQTQTATDFFFVPNQSFSQSVPIPPTPLFPQGEELSVESGFQFEFDGFTIDFDSVILKGGDLSLQIETNIAADIRTSVSIESLVIQNSPFVTELTSDYPGSKNLRTETVDFDLSDSKLELTSSADPVSAVRGAMQIAITGRNEPLLAGDILDISLNISGMEFLRIHGTIPPTPITQDPDTLLITFFESINSGTFAVTEPQIKFKVQNSFGLPAEVNFDGIKVRKGAEELNLEGPVTETGVPIPAPAEINANPEMAEIEINAENSNLPDMIEILPNEFIYQFKGLLNPQSRPELFVWDTSKIAIDYEVTVPLEGWVDQMSLTRDYEFDGDLLSDVENVDFRIRSQNQLPLSLLMQFYFLDASREVIDSLLVDDRQIINPADVDQNGESRETIETEKIISFSPEKTARITNARFIRVEAEVSSTDVSNRTAIRILSENRLRVAIGMQTNVSTEL